MTYPIEPIVSLVHEQAPDGTYVARLVVSGLQTERAALAALDHMERLFCGAEVLPQAGGPAA